MATHHRRACIFSLLPSDDMEKNRTNPAYGERLVGQPPVRRLCVTKEQRAGAVGHMARAQETDTCKLV